MTRVAIGGAGYTDFRSIVSSISMQSLSIGMKARKNKRGNPYENPQNEESTMEICDIPARDEELKNLLNHPSVELKRTREVWVSDSWR